jgi:hypothetical protein
LGTAIEDLLGSPAEIPCLSQQAKHPHSPRKRSRCGVRSVKVQHAEGITERERIARIVSGRVKRLCGVRIVRAVEGIADRERAA